MENIFETIGQLIKPEPSDNYLHMNHHHELTGQHEIVNFGAGDFVANKIAIPLLKALNEAGLITRTHHIDQTGGFVSILLDNVTIEVRQVSEIHAHRTQFNGKQELLIRWNK